jgi:hypothetical protein
MHQNAAGADDCRWQRQYEVMESPATAGSGHADCLDAASLILFMDARNFNLGKSQIHNLQAS